MERQNESQTFFDFLKQGHEFEDAWKCLNVNYSAPRVDMVTFKCKYSFFIWLKEKRKPQFYKRP